MISSNVIAAARLAPALLTAAEKGLGQHDEVVTLLADALACPNLQVNLGLRGLHRGVVQFKVGHFGFQVGKHVLVQLGHRLVEQS